MIDPKLYNPVWKRALLTEREIAAGPPIVDPETLAAAERHLSALRTPMGAIATLIAETRDAIRSTDRPVPGTATDALAMARAIARIAAALENLPPIIQGRSGDGIDVVGDQRSIERVKDAMHALAILPQLRALLAKYRNELEASERDAAKWRRVHATAPLTLEAMLAQAEAKEAGRG